MELKLTGRGTYLLLKALAGESAIHFRHMEIGNGKAAGNNANGLSNPLLTSQIDAIEILGDGFVRMSTSFNNANVTSSFRANELGVFADDPENAGKTLLYAYGYAANEKADYIPTVTEQSLETKLEFLVYIGGAKNVSATLSQSLIYASKQELENHINATGNVHSLMAEDIGLGNVENVGVNDMTPTYTVATNLTELKSKEKMTTAFGKIAKAIKSLIVHIADKENPHEVKCNQIGAQPAGSYAAASHSHGTSDITSGTLGIARGGTGGSTAEKARANLEAAAAKHNHNASNITAGILPVERGGTGVSSLTGSDFSTSRVRGISFASKAPDAVQNGHIVFVYAS